MYTTTQDYAVYTCTSIYVAGLCKSKDCQVVVVSCFCKYKYLFNSKSHYGVLLSARDKLKMTCITRMSSMIPAPDWWAVCDLHFFYFCLHLADFLPGLWHWLTLAWNHWKPVLSVKNDVKVESQFGILTHFFHQHMLRSKWRKLEWWLKKQDLFT